MLDRESYQRWQLELPQELEELLAAELWARGCLGIEVKPSPEDRGRLRFEVYFPEPLPAAFHDFDRERWRRRGVELLSAAPFAERDWLAEHRQRARPIAVGRRFRIDPRDPDLAPDPMQEDDPITLQIPAQRAFGTGSHESTRLAIRWLEELDLAGLEVLDVGAGSGILSFAAVHLGARRVVGFDPDFGAVAVARANARRNGLAVDLFAGRVAALAPRRAFDLALVNVLPERVLGEIPELLRCLGAGARVVSSGNLWRRRRELLEKLAAMGLNPLGEKRENEWIAFLLAAPGGVGR